MLSMAPGTREYASLLLESADQLANFDMSLAKRTYEEACLAAESLRDAQLFSRALARLAWHLAQGGELDLALIRATHARTIAESISSVVSICGAKYVLAWIRSRVGDHATAISMWREMIHAAKIIDDKQREADYLCELGVLLRTMGNFGASIEAHIAAHTIYEALGDWKLPMCKNNVAMSLVNAGRITDAIVWATQAIDSCPADKPLFKSQMMHTLGWARFKLEDYAAARKHFVDSIVILPKSNGDLRHATAQRLDFGHLEMAVNDVPEAIKHFEHALDIATASKDVGLIAQAHGALYRVYMSIGALEEALKHCERETSTTKQRERAENDMRISVLRAQDVLVFLRNEWSRDVFAANYPAM